MREIGCLKRGAVMEPSLPQSSLDIAGVCPTPRPDVRLPTLGGEFADRRPSTFLRHDGGRLFERVCHSYKRELNFRERPTKMSACC